MTASLLLRGASRRGRSGCAPDRWFGRVSPRRATHFLLLRQEKVSKEKATLLSATLRCAAGNLRCSGSAGSGSNSPCGLKQSPALTRRPLRSSAHTEGTRAIHGPSLRSAKLNEYPSARSADEVLSLVSGCWIGGSAVMRRRVAQVWADQGWRLFEAIAEFEPDPVQTEQRSVPAGPTNPVRLLLLTFLGEARKVSRPPGRNPACQKTKLSRRRK